MTACGIRIRLDSNESPFDLPTPLKENVLDQLRAIPFNRYPQSLAADLKRTIASRIGVDGTQVTLGNGLDEVIHIILQTFGPGRRVIVQKPSFAMYGSAAMAACTVATRSGSLLTHCRPEPCATSCRDCRGNA